MNFKDSIPHILALCTKSLTYIGKLVWSCIIGIATVITFLLIFALLLAILPRPLVWLVSVASLLWFVYNYRDQITIIIAALIAFGLALMLLYSINRSLFPDWIMTKSSSAFRINFSNKSFGLTQYKNETFDSLTCYGATQLDNVSIRGPLAIYGQLDANKLSIQGPITIYGHAELDDITCKDEITVYGKLTLDKGTISGKTKIYGGARIEQSTVDDLVTYARKITLTSSTVKNIHMKKDTGKVTVTLVKTKVNGDITFDCGNGRVILDRESSISGKVIDGNIEVR